MECFDLSLRGFLAATGCHGVFHCWLIYGRVDNAVPRNARLEDLPAIARCHRLAFPRSLSTAMGKSYVAHMLGWYLAEPRAFLFWIEEGGRCIGYCGGLLVDGRTRIGSASGMAQFSFNAAMRAIVVRPWLLLHPEFLSKYRFVLKNLMAHFRKKKPARPQESTSQPPHAGLVVIGVDPGFLGRGYGSRLLVHFELVARNAGYSLLMLTVLSHNVTAIKAYERNGWVVSTIQGSSTTMEKRLV